MRRSGQTIPAFAGALLAASALAQSGEPVDQGFTDVSPLGASLREIRIDPRAVRTFDRIETVPGRDDLYMRQSGALSAVFPQSDYALIEENDQAQVIPVIPAGTVFYIGPVLPTVGAPKAPARPTSISRPLASLTFRAPAPATTPAWAVEFGDAESPTPARRLEPAPGAQNISTESYRRVRLREITRTLAPQAP